MIEKTDFTVCDSCCKKVSNEITYGGLGKLAGWFEIKVHPSGRVFLPATDIQHFCSLGCVETHINKLKNNQISPPTPPKNNTLCPNCSNRVDLNDNFGHKKGCMYVYGRRGWRLAGEYDS